MTRKAPNEVQERLNKMTPAHCQKLIELRIVTLYGTEEQHTKAKQRFRPLISSV